MSDPLMFPGRTVRPGDDRRDVVTRIQDRLNGLGFPSLAADGDFGPATRAAVQRFQTGRGLLADGIVGPATWAELFGPPPRERAGLSGAVLEVAGREVGTRESGGPNRGPRVDEYLRNVGLDPTRGSFAWCQAFVYFCFSRAATTLGVTNPCLKTAGVMVHWSTAPKWTRVPVATVLSAPSSISPGSVFIVDHGGGKGHTGLVERVSQASVFTIEGNTDDSGGREGDGVYRRVRQMTNMVGFIDYSLPRSS